MAPGLHHLLHCDCLGSSRRICNLCVVPLPHPPAPSVGASVIFAAFSERVGHDCLGSSGLTANPADLMASRIDLPAYSLGTCCSCSPGSCPDSPWGPESLAGDSAAPSPRQWVWTCCPFESEGAEGPSHVGRQAAHMQQHLSSSAGPLSPQQRCWIPMLNFCCERMTPPTYSKNSDLSRSYSERTIRSSCVPGTGEIVGIRDQVWVQRIYHRGRKKCTVSNTCSLEGKLGLT